MFEIGAQSKETSMTMKMLGHSPQLTLKITKDIIDRSTTRNSNHCMVAEAVRKAHPNLTHIAVDIQTIRASDFKKRERYVWLTPRKVQQLIVDFDMGKPIDPFQCTLTEGQTIEVGQHWLKTDEQKTKAKKRAKRLEALRKKRNGNRHTIPVKVGGKAPPRSIGARRSFGLRSLEY